MYQDTRGVQVRDFLEANEARLKDKHFLYVVSTNLEEDTYLRRRSTRGSKDGINVKIGMSQSGVTARLKSYTHMSSNFDPRFPQSGIRVLFLKQFPRRKSGETGSSIVARVETRLKQILREMDRSVDGRGSEVFRIQPEELFQIIEDIGNADASYEPRRQSERFGKNLLWMITDSATGKQTMMFAEDYDEVLMRFAEDNDVSLLDERSKYITRFYIRRVGSVPRQSRPFVEAMSQPMTEDSTVNFSVEALTEGQGESSHKRRREEPRLNIKNLRLGTKVFFFKNWSQTVTSAKRSDASPFLVRLGVDVTLKRRWKLEDLVPGKKRFARSVVWKTLHKNLNLKDALSCLAPRGFDVMLSTLLMKRTARIKRELSHQARLGFDVTLTTVVLRVGRDVLRSS